MAKTGSAPDPQSPAMSLPHFQLLGKILKAKYTVRCLGLCHSNWFQLLGPESTNTKEGGKNSKLTQEIAADWNVIPETYLKRIK